MKKIRDDLDGVVYVRAGADVVTLRAGDDVPEGVDVADHLVAGDEAPDPKRRGRPAKASDDESGNGD